MGKRIVKSLKWTAIICVFLAVSKYFSGESEWLIEALDWGIPAGAGYFIGYGHAQKYGNW